MALPDPITQLKAARRLLSDSAEILLDLEDAHFGGLSYMACEKAVNDALGHSGDVSWNNMILEIKTLKLASKV